jgi:prepilin-type N-terminal cleavage/methylation domain-containing protein
MTERAERLVRPARSRRRGLSLLEVMIAMGILAVGMLGMLSMQVQALSSTSTGRHVSDAMRIGLDQLEQLKYQGWAATPVSSWTPVVNVTGPESIATPAGVTPQTFGVSWRVQPVGALSDVRLIDVRVTWREPGDPPAMPDRRYAVSSFKYNGAGTPP